MRATVADSWQLRWRILGQGDGVQVLKPAALRGEITTIFRRMAACLGWRITMITGEHGASGA